MVASSEPIFESAVASNQESWVNVVMDRVFRQDNQILLIMTVGCDADKVLIEAIILEVQGKTDRVLNGLGLRFSKATEK